MINDIVNLNSRNMKLCWEKRELSFYLSLLLNFRTKINVEDL